MDGTIETALSQGTIIDDTNHEKGRMQLEKLLEQQAYYDPSKGKTTLVYRGASSEEEIRVTMENGGDIFVADSTYEDERYWYESQLKGGMLYQDIRLQLLSWENEWLRSPLMPHFTFWVDHSVNYFRRQGKDVNGMVGAWYWRSDDGIPNVNWNTYQKELQQGRISTEAALLTPTGKAAKRHGFTDVSIEPYDVTLEGGIVNQGIKVSFVKPQIAT